MAPINASNPKPFRVHVTGFGPFRDIKENPSDLATQPLSDVTLRSPPRPFRSDSPAVTLAQSTTQSTSSNESSPRSIHITTECVPVTYRAVSERIHVIHDVGSLKQTEDTAGSRGDGPFDLVLHVGVGLPGAFKLEQRARRYGYEGLDAESNNAPEVDGLQGYVDEEWDGIAGEGPDGEELWTGVDVTAVRNWVKMQGVQHLELSDDAGLYLCEFIFFGSQAAAKRTKTKGRQPIVQFLHIPPIDVPYSLEDLTHVISLIIWAIVNEGGIQ